MHSTKRTVVVVDITIYKCPFCKKGKGLVTNGLSAIHRSSIICDNPGCYKTIGDFEIHKLTIRENTSYEILKDELNGQ